MKEDHVWCLFKYTVQGLIKHLENHNQTLTN